MISHERRQEVIDYVIQKYGEDRVAQIITFEQWPPEQPFVMWKGFESPLRRSRQVAKMIPMEIGMTIDKALKEIQS